MATCAPIGTSREKVEFPHRQIYFHIKGKRQQVCLIEGKNKTWAKKHLSRIRDERLVYYKPDCLRKSQLCPEKSISKEKSENMNENLVRLLSAVSKEPSVKGISFQARFGSLYFLLPKQHGEKKLSTEELLQQSHRKEFLFGVPFDPQYFMQGDYLSADPNSETSEYYKVYFTMEDASAASRMDKQENGTFKHIWTCAKTRESKSSSWHDMTNFDIVRPGSLVDVRMTSILDRPCCSETENVVFHQAAEEIAKSMKVSATDGLSEPKITMQIVGDNYYVYCVRKKCTKLYKWVEKPEWNMVHCQANTSININEKTCKEMWKKKQKCDYTVELGINAKEELYFNGTNHPTRPTVTDAGPTRMATTDHQLLSDFQSFVSASFDVAELLEDTCPHGSH